MTILLLMDLRRIFQTFHECVYFLLSVQFVRIRVVVFHDFVCKISKKPSEITRSRGKSILGKSGENYAKETKQNLKKTKSVYLN